MATWNWHIASLIGTTCMAIMVLLLRLRAAGKPVRELTLLLPPLGMSTGFSMFLIPAMRVPPGWGLAAFGAGALLLSYPLIRTSVLEIKDRRIVLRRSRTLMVLLVFLVALRLALHSYLEQHITIAETASLFFLLAFGMLLPWRIAMLLQYQRMLAIRYGSSRHNICKTKDGA